MRLSRQRGFTTVEFALVGGLFFMLLFGVMEVGRAMYVWNTLVEATRRAARVAVVCPVNDPSIARVGLFTDPAAGGDPVISGLSSENFTITYLDRDGASTADFLAVRFVRVEITGYTHRLMIPFIDRVLTAPTFATTLPRESLGVPRFESEPVGCSYP